MKILFLGLGSIGQRHLQNAKKIFNESEFFALRLKKNNLIIKNTKIKKKTNLEKYYKIKAVYDYKSALKIEPNLTFICNPSSMHLRDAIRFAKIKSHLFIEKPLGRSKKQEKKLSNILKKNKLISMVGYQSRYHPLIKKIKNILKKKIFGKIVHVNVNHLTYLPHHHKYENYRESYAAQKKLGGGVIGGLIHEIDLIGYFFGLPYSYQTVKKNSGHLGINCEDNFMSFMKFKKKENKFSLFLRLSYSHQKEERNLSIFFEKAVLNFCFIKNEIKIYSNKKKLNKTFKIRLNRNFTFLQQLKVLKKSLLLKKNPETSIDNNHITQNLFHRLAK